MKIVHVTSEANARPIMTALTMISADMNIDHGDSSRRIGFDAFGSDVALSAAAGVVAAAAG